MGSKRSMLASGLGSIIRSETAECHEFADVFCGSAAVSWYVAQNTDVPVFASDLQEFAVVLAASVVCRDIPINAVEVWETWRQQAFEACEASSFYKSAMDFEDIAWEQDPVATVAAARGICESANDMPIMKAYGGYYFSPFQALMIDSLRATLPAADPEYTTALASLIRSSAQCAAAPGHTAQPFKPSPSAARYLFSSWRKDVLERTKRSLEEIAPRYAKRIGRAVACDALESVGEVAPGAVIFIDPPYSNVQYSRFYHVLETITKGSCASVSGEGRYPPASERPQSNFSIRRKSKEAMTELIERVALNRSRAIVTFPAASASNGLSGDYVAELCGRYFHVKKDIINGRFSTLGGNSRNRNARIPAYEVVLTLSPKL